MLSLAGGTSSGTFAAPVYQGNGVYTSIFTGTTAGTASSLATTINSISLTGNNPTVQVTPSVISLSQSTLTLGSASLTGAGTTTATLALKDAYGNAISDTSEAGNLTFALTATTAGLAQATFGSVSAVAGSPGQYQATVTGTTAGTSNTLQATLGGPGVTGTFSMKPSFTVAHGAVSPTVSTIASSPSSVTDDGVTSSFVTVTLVDAYSNPVSSKAVVLSTSRAGLDTITPASGSSNASGQVTFTVKSTTKGFSTYTAVDTTDSNLTLNPYVPATVTFTAGTLNTSNSTVTVDSATETDNGTSAAHVTVNLLDSTSNGISGKAVTLTSSRPGSDTVTAVSATTNSNGAATFTVTSTASGTSVYTAKDATDSNTIAGSVNVTYNTGLVSQSLATVTSTATTLVGDSVYNATITVTVRDATVTSQFKDHLNFKVI